MQNIGYEYRNSYQSLGALTFIIFLYFLRMAISIFFKVLILVLRAEDEENILVKIYRTLSKNIFFNQIISLSLESYMEFYIKGLMNLKTADYSTNGEWLGILISYFIFFMIHGVIPLLLIYLLSIDLSKLKSEYIQPYIGALYEGKKVNSKFQLAYTLVFVLRRGIFMTIGMFILN